MITDQAVRAYCRVQGYEGPFTDVQYRIKDAGAGPTITGWNVPGVTEPEEADLTDYHLGAVKARARERVREQADVKRDALLPESSGRLIDHLLQLDELRQYAVDDSPAVAFYPLLSAYAEHNSITLDQARSARQGVYASALATMKTIKIAELAALDAIDAATDLAGVTSVFPVDWSGE